ncbi:MAG: GTP 3',8-cyclase MoaA [Candidatus Sericytochromatia bacterium]|nr:GTP 3',8-cyclase MoaA [Candidatus Sericytochromatia bacterium]
MLLDSHGRQATKLRISVTDRCNFRCTYCMPEEGLVWQDRAALLSYEEILRLARLFVDLGVTQIRLTGGEPLLRRDLPVLVKGLKALPGLQKLAITTNGTLLEQLGPALYAAGLRSFNISLDSLDPVRFQASVRRDALQQVLNGLHSLSRWPDCEVKLNTVVVRGHNEDEAVAFARLARLHGWQARFIEFMPLGQDDAWAQHSVVPGEELRQAIDRVYPLKMLAPAGKNPAARWGFVDGTPGEVGFINSVTEPFCHSCNRIRLTADGQLRTCLFSLRETDLKSPLRQGLGDAELIARIQDAIWQKEAGHLIAQPQFERPLRTMSRIGG